MLQKLMLFMRIILTLRHKCATIKLKQQAVKTDLSIDIGSFAAIACSDLSGRFEFIDIGGVRLGRGLADADQPIIQNTEGERT